MKLEVGKFYKTRDGRKVRIIFNGLNSDYPIIGIVDNGNHKEYAASFTANGEVLNLHRVTPNGRDIVSEWEEPKETTNDQVL